MSCRDAVALRCCASVDGKGVWQTRCKQSERGANWFAAVLVPSVSAERGAELGCAVGGERYPASGPRSV